ncbi:hypothetical protein ACQPW1_44285 [Nocardia sp. CA-128927]|uniref:hypothetical protein n=1 Tax=Nocardia sp. CA-128927 TaxID=3239975 RepID=UPI003D97B142
MTGRPIGPDLLHPDGPDHPNGPHGANHPDQPNRPDQPNEPDRPDEPNHPDNKGNNENNGDNGDNGDNGNDGNNGRNNNGGDGPGETGLPADEYGSVFPTGHPLGWITDADPDSRRSVGMLRIRTPSWPTGAGLESLVIPVGTEAGESTTYLLTALPRIELDATGKLTASAGYLGIDERVTTALKLFNSR